MSAFLHSVVSADIAVDDVCNVGDWYDLGFCLGIGAFTKGTDTAATTTGDTAGWWGESND
ncbi:MAG: hypothetical protein ABEL76_08870 [Bradymonadaceae bacterium]